MGKRYRYANAAEGTYTQKRVDEDGFHGYVCHIKLGETGEPWIVHNAAGDICIKDSSYEWLEVYPDGAHYAITVMFDAAHRLIEWYFDIAKAVGTERGIPYEDDLYLDMVFLPDGQKLILDEDELLQALKDGEITKEDVDLAYQTLHGLEARYADDLEALICLTEHLCKTAV